MNDLRSRLGLKPDAAPLPGEAAYEDTEIGRAPGQLPAASPFESTVPTKFRVISYDESSCKVEEFSDLDSVGRYAGKQGMVWIQVLGITDPQIVHIVGAFFDIPMLAQEDILTATSRPKFEEHGEKLLAIARAVRIGVEEDTPRGQQISIVAAQNWVISFHENDEKVFEAIERRIADNKGNIRKWHAGYLVYSLLDTLVDRLLYQTEEIEDATTELEDSILKGTDDWDLNEVYRLKRIVVRLSRLAQPLKDMVSVLEHYEHPLLPTSLDMFLRDLYDHAIRAADRIEHARMILQDLQEYHHTQQERKTNEVIRVLTVMSSVFIPLTFLVGLWGMNFHFMPEIHTEWGEKYGYFLALGSMGALATGIILWMKRKRWF
ncbi:MAG: magnesium/cobalt transporter CorA [Opitutales bacterium]|jgi:magnesium transporter|nr:magnesium/cobalt transporter CorA [Opitutales bacterium]MDP4659355.1 magnesium/cobalt transporter CorA [Opitutales bacterium]MDP4775017.1 magnesium/cobalt transporter CorA [Opitutales bacterium]MDP4787986.1 magnesium/cobalt transporter CorA [Opitutales bacterium]MDP4861630.1 magnesium/cobalt transporter CorA [Opitutales bacterium]